MKSKWEDESIILRIPFFDTKTSEGSDPKTSWRKDTTLLKLTERLNMMRINFFSRMNELSYKFSTATYRDVLSMHQRLLEEQEVALSPPNTGQMLAENFGLTSEEKDSQINRSNIGKSPKSSPKESPREFIYSFSPRTPRSGH